MMMDDDRRVSFIINIFDKIKVIDKLTMVDFSREDVKTILQKVYVNKIHIINRKNENVEFTFTDEERNFFMNQNVKVI